MFADRALSMHAGQQIADLQFRDLRSIQHNRERIHFRKYRFVRVTTVRSGLRVDLA